MIDKENELIWGEDQSNISFDCNDYSIESVCIAAGA